MPFQRRGSIEGTSHPSGRSRRPSRYNLVVFSIVHRHHQAPKS
jgi:hypothetical protein